MEQYTYWFLLALLLAALEMATGTFYLLVLGIAMAVGGLASLLNASFALQLVLSAVAAVAGTIVLRQMKARTATPSSASSLDVGQPVKVLSWRDDGTARALYRGTEWDAEPENHSVPRDTTLYIRSMHGSRMILTHHKPKQ